MNQNNLRKNHIFLKLRYSLFVTFLAALIISVLDTIIDWLFYFNGRFIDVLLPPINSHDFFNKIMLFSTFTIFGIILHLFLKKRFADQQSIIESEVRFRTIANYTKDWEYWISPERQMLFISPSCINITGYSAQEFYDRPDLLNEIIYKDDKNIFAGHEKNALLGNDVDTIEFRINTKDKQVIWMDHSCQSVYDLDGNYIGHRVSNRNITLRKEVDAKLRETARKLEEKNKILKEKVDLSYLELEAIILQSPYAKTIFDKYGNTISVNSAWRELFKRETQFKNILEIATKNDELRKQIDKILKEGGTFKSEPIYFEELDKMIKLSIYESKNLNGDIEKIVCNYEDVTDQIRRLEYDRELEMQRIISKKMFGFLEAERKHISKELHDQIGQKLMLIKMNTEILKGNFPKAEKKIDEIIKLLQNTNKDIKDIIFSLHPVELEHYGLIAALDSMINRCSDIGNYKPSIHIYGKYSSLGKDMELAIYRICQEIASNITKHSEATEANFEFHFKENEFIGIISDNGVGFNIEEYQMNGNKPRSFGLVSVQERAKILNGYLEYQSKINEGTKIYFRIPLKEEPNGKN